MPNIHGDRQPVDNGDEARLDLKRKAVEAGHLQSLPQDLAAAAPKAPPEETEEEQEAQRTPNKKQKIKNDESLRCKSDPAAEPLCITADILKDVLPTAVAFVEPTDRYSMALANSNLRDAVETHSKNMLGKIRKEHAVGETFEDRIRDQTGIQTTRTKPVELPDRYLLEAAKNTPLYTIVEPTMHGRLPSLGSFALNPSKNRLVFAELLYGEVSCCSVRIYDLKTKHCVQTFSFQTCLQERDSFVRKVDYHEDSIVVFTQYVIRVFTETGKLVHQFQTEGLRELEEIFGSTRLERVVFFDCSDGIFSLDICSGESKKIMEFEDYNPVNDILGVCHSRWLVADVEHHPEPRAAIVYDLNNGCLENHRLVLPVGMVAQCTENPSIFYSRGTSLGEDVVHVFELSNEGKLSRISSFPVPTSGFLHCSLRRRLFLQPHGRKSRLQVVRTVDGKVEGSLAVPTGYYIDALVPHGTEVFFGLSNDHSVAREQHTGTMVAAFLSELLL